MSEKKKQPWLTGEIFDGHFEVGHLIARGGMAEVYHGVDLWSNNPVAIKVLSPQLSADPSQQQKFFREERSLRQISHEHVVAVLGSGTQDVRGFKLMFIVLDYVHGSTLQQLLNVRPLLSVGEMLEIILPVAEGLSEVHAHRLIHRDIKPSNILLSSLERSIKLTDFGLTRRTDQSWTGELMGTPAYVAPEIVDPKATVGSGADIFALGIVMFRMLAGRLPFTGLGDDQHIIYHNVNTEIPSLSQYAPGIDPDLVGIIKWCTRKQANARPVDGTELFEVLSNLRAKLTEQELSFRAELDQPITTALWDDVELIAEQTGATRVLQHTSISGFGAVDDDLADDAEDYRPQAILGVGPEPDPASSAPDDHSDEDWDDIDSFSYYGDGDDTFIYTPETESVEPGAPVFEPISASYRSERHPGSHSSIPRTSQFEAVPQRRQDDSDTASQRARDPRQPVRSWHASPEPQTLVLGFLGVLLAFVVAGFVGWQLAQSVIQADWFAQWNSFLDGFGQF